MIRLAVTSLLELKKMMIKVKNSESSEPKQVWYFLRFVFLYLNKKVLFDEKGIVNLWAFGFKSPNCVCVPSVRDILPVNFSL